LSHKTRVASQGLCPLIVAPYKDCYCIGMNSQKVKDALCYCGGEFERCEIYIRHLQEDYLKHLVGGNNGEVISRGDDNV
jgi:hypothetical protein